MSVSELVDDVEGIESGVVSDGLGDDLERFREHIDDELFLSFNFGGFFFHVAAELDFGGSSAGYDLVGLETSSDNHDGIIQRPFGFLDELFGTTSKDDGSGFGVGAVFEKIVPFSSDLLFVELSAGSEDIGGQFVDGGLENGSGGLRDSLDILVGDSTSTENASVGEPLGSQVTNGELGENNLGTDVMNFLEFIVDDLPFGIDQALEILNVFDSDFGILFF